jgi:hypothetical protein
MADRMWFYLGATLVLSVATAAPVLSGDDSLSEELLRATRAHVQSFAPVDHPENLYCDACTAVANAILGQGCSLACSTVCAGIPGCATVCGWILDETGVCDLIKRAIAAGETPVGACTDIGFCGSSCECGVCTREAADPSTGRCLGLPYDCGHPNAEPSFMRDRSLPPVPRVNGEVRGESEFCIGAKCDGNSANYGCCLSCL